jgi:rhamnulokinase
MKGSAHCAAVDLGASSGRVIVGSWSGKRLTLTEVYRFANRFHSLGANDYWDLPRLWSETKIGLLRAKEQFPSLASVGVDTWGVDYVLLDRRGRLVFPVHAYRDGRTSVGMKRLSLRGLERIYQATGIPNVFYNTSLQLEETLRSHPGVKMLASRCLFLADYFNFLLSGRMANELSIASTSQLIDVAKVGWSNAALARFRIPRRWLSPPIKAGALLGPITGIPGLEESKMIAVPGHDTACAFDAIPASPDGTDVFISSGTWSLIGFESSTPLLSRGALKARISNERTGDGLYRPLTNVIGMWLIERMVQELTARPIKKDAWDKLITAAERGPSPKMRLDLNDSAFANPHSMRAAIDSHLARKGTMPPEDLAGYVRLICDSLGWGHAQAVRTFEQLAGRTFKRILIVGGGARNRLLCQATADAARKSVIALEIEASAVGNVARQLMALGLVKDLPSFRRDFGRQVSRKVYEPRRR